MLSMTITDLFINRAGRLRSGWRLALFLAITQVLIELTVLLIPAALGLVLGSADRASALLAGPLGYVMQALVILAAAALTGWWCGRVFEGLPPRALGWALHRGWWGDLLVGSLIGAGSIGLAVLIGAAGGGFRLHLGPGGPSVVRTLVVSAGVFTLAAAAEETLFRGYPLQTLLRSLPAWIAVALPSALFALVHLANPHVVPGFTFVNTTLAGIWMAVAYIRSRSLWLPLGLHWAWNWTQGALLGLPVSGITTLAPAPLMRALDTGPAWLTGGAYGIEGGAACTIALMISIAFVWLARFISATEEMKQFTSNMTDARP